MKQIPLTNSEKAATVDDDDYDFVMWYKWQFEDGFAVTEINGREVEMGSLIMSRMLRQRKITPCLPGGRRWKR